MSSARSVLCEQDIAWFDDLPLTGTGLELEPAAEGDHVLAVRSVVPVEAGARSGLFEGNGPGRFAERYGTQGLGLVPFDLANRKMGLVAVTGEEANEPDRQA